MTTVTREGVAEAMFLRSPDARWLAVSWSDLTDHGKSRWLEEADALIAAFPHLVGEVFEKPSQIEVDVVKGVARLSKVRERTVYTVTGPWRKVVR